MESICEVGNSKLIVCGDFNAHNTLWGSIKTDGNGSVIEEFMDDNLLVCSIGAGIKVHEIWGMIRKMGGIRWDVRILLLKNNNTEAVINGDKAEMLAKAFVRIHRSENLSSEELFKRMRTIEENRNMLGAKEVGESTTEANFTPASD